MTQKNSVAQVRALLDPRNIVIAGASDRPGSWSKNVWRALRRCGYTGKIYPLNPRAQSVWDGETCYPDFAALPEPPDHVAVLVPGAAAISCLRDAGKAGARSATIFSSGFGEGGDEQGRALGAALDRAIRESGLAVSGPNCLGNLAARFGLCTIPDDRITDLPAGSVGLFGQSGGIVMAIYRALKSRGISPAYAITAGNEIGLTTADYIHFMIEDPDVKVICCFIEAIRDEKSFLEACSAAFRARKPIVAMKIGGSEASRAAALAHTGSLAGSLACFDAVTRPLGVMRVDTIDELVECAEYLTHARIPAGPRLGAITFSGGLKGLFLEGAERNGLSFPPLAPATLDSLGAILGVGTSLGNPLDAGFAALSSAEAYFRCIDILLSDPGIDLLLVQEELPLKEGQNAKAGNLRTVDRMVVEGSGKPVAVVSMASYMYSDFTRTFREGFPNLAVLHEVDKALKAAGHVGRYGARLTIAPPSRLAQPLSISAQTNLGSATRTPDGRHVLGEGASKAILCEYGLNAPAELHADNAGAAVEAAEKIGFPVVLKLVSDDVQHKSDVGGVLVGLQSGDDVRHAFEAIRTSLKHHRPEARFGGVLVVAQVAGGLELVLGVHRDPEVGLVTMFGTGGVLLELQKDVAFGPVPLDERVAGEMLDRTTAGRMLEGYRGAPKRDRDAVIAALVGLSHVAQDIGDRLESIDINPLVALEAGRGACMLDALIVLRAS